MTKINNLLLIIIAVLLASWTYQRQVSELPVLASDSLPRYSSNELAQYNGEDLSKPIYLALDGYVYDVSAGGDNFYKPGESYHDLAGRDASQDLHVFGGEIIKRKYPIIGVYLP